MATKAPKTEATYTIPLRAAFLKVSRVKKTPRAVRAVKEFLARHMKSDKENIRLGPKLNEALWARGIRNPPHKVTVHAKMDGELVRAELEGHEFVVLRPTEKKEKAAGLKGKLQELQEQVKGDKDKKSESLDQAVAADKDAKKEEKTATKKATTAKTEDKADDKKE